MIIYISFAGGFISPSNIFFRYIWVHCWPRTNNELILTFHSPCRSRDVQSSLFAPKKGLSMKAVVIFAAAKRVDVVAIWICYFLGVCVYAAASACVFFEGPLLCFCQRRHVLLPSLYYPFSSKLSHQLLKIMNTQVFNIPKFYLLSIFNMYFYTILNTWF